MIWQSASIVLILIISAGVSYAMMLVVWQQRSKPGALPFAAMLLSATIWSASSALEYASPEASGKILSAKFEYLGISTLAVFWLIFALEYSQQSKWFGAPKRRFALLLLSVIPVITILLAFSNGRHGLVWSSVMPASDEPFAPIIYQHGPWFPVIVVYSYILILSGTVLLLRSVVRYPRAYRNRAIAIVIGVALPWLANFIYVCGLVPLLELDPTPLAFAITGVIYTWGVFRSQWFEVLPVALDILVASLPDGVVVLDEGRFVLYLNDAAQTILGVEQAIGQTASPIFNAFPEIASLCQEEDRTHAEVWGTENPRRCLDIRVDDLHDRSGHPAGQLVLMRDITRRKHVEEQMRLQSVALESAASAIVITDRDGTIDWVNPSFTRITGYSAQEAIGQNPRILKSGEQDPTYYTDLWHTIVSGQNWRGELINKRKDGSRYIESMTIAPVPDEHGQISHFIAIKQDITQRKELEQLRDDLMGALVHDLRNPLHAILASLDTFRMFTSDVELDEDARDLLQISRDSAWRMVGMVNAILDSASLEAGKMALKLEAVELAPVAEQIARLQSPLAQKGDILILVDVPFDLPPVLADVTLLARILQNLCDNAIKFTPAGGDVEISARFEAETGMVVVSVRDGGPGIPVGLRAHLFDKFATGDSPRRGTGMGLAFCRLAVEAQGGKVWVGSEPDQGATFLFSLPVASPAVPAS